MRADQEKYILENVDKKSAQQLARDLGVTERKIKRFIRLRHVPVRRSAKSKSFISPASRKKLLTISILVIIFVTAIVFIASLFNGFIEWDDPDYVYENPLIRTFSPGNIEAIFTRSFQGAYCPLTIISYACEYHFFKANPFIYHFTNYILHIAVSLLVFASIYLLAKDMLVALFVSLIFGIHPLHVESVAWIAERKDVLYAFFYMLAILAYQRYLIKRRYVYYLLCLFLAVLSFFAKPMAVTLPIILFLFDYMYGREFKIPVILEKIPIFVIALLVGFISYKFQVISGVTNIGADNLVRVYFILKQIPFYLSKMAFPFPLSAVYMFYNIGPEHNIEIYFNIFLLITLSGIVLFSMRYTKNIFFGAAFFLITLAPVLKIIPVGDVFAADRYMYIPSIGILYIAGVLIRRLVFNERCNSFLRVAVTLILMIWIVFLGAITIQRCGIWKNSETFFLDILRQNPGVPTANNNLGGYYIGRGEYDKAMVYLERALEGNPSAELRSMIEENLRIARFKKGLSQN